MNPTAEPKKVIGYHGLFSNLCRYIDRYINIALDSRQDISFVVDIYLDAAGKYQE